MKTESLKEKTAIPRSATVNQTLDSIAIKKFNQRRVECFPWSLPACKHPKRSKNSLSLLYDLSNPSPPFARTLFHPVAILEFSAFRSYFLLSFRKLKCQVNDKNSRNVSFQKRIYRIFTYQRLRSRKSESLSTISSDRSYDRFIGHRTIENYKARTCFYIYILTYRRGRRWYFSIVANTNEVAVNSSYKFDC